MGMLDNDDQESDQRNLSSNFNGSGYEGDEIENEEDEDEEEDLDFNPFLKGTPLPEASSSLSSEVEGLDGNSPKPLDEVTNYAVGDSEHGEEVVMQTAVSPGSEREVQKLVHRKSKKRKNDFRSQLMEENIQEKDDNSLDNVMNADDEDAICKRTRARYSLANFTLDELETFLQETDDEDDLQHVDDEEEYRKFLAAVLQDGDGDGQSTHENENVDDEDEDNDADFEIELEELLESEVDDSTRDKDRIMEYERAGRRPETRQNKRQKTSAQYKKKLLEQSKRPLRPLLPVAPNGTVTSFSTIDGKTLIPAPGPTYLPSRADEGLINGFTFQQIGHLHCLIHEHVQLLIQVYSLCIHDPSRQHIASQLKRLILEMLQRRDEVIASKSVPYPDTCFRPPFVCPSVVDDAPGYLAHCSFLSSPAPSVQIPISHHISPSKGRRENALNEDVSSSQAAGSVWVPFLSGPIVSILDVAPLNLVRRYIDDVYIAVRAHRQCHVDSSCDTWYEKDPLFHLPCIPLSMGNSEVARGNSPPTANTSLSTPGEPPPKKTLAASIVESAKKQSVALVPKDISKLAKIFFPLFNRALFPHKPPPAAVANRVLFTDSEDELLALGIIEYNTDWKAIQQRFLPCKSTHQIFVRQKNRCSSKAPENPIKAVRRMKTSPLSAQEIESIQEGLRIFKLDWMSVWKFVVPHRDPSLLPRQWRIALGTQRSYKLDAVQKEKRRMYEAKRRRCKTTHLENWQLASEKEDNQVDGTSGGNNSGDEYVDNNANEAYVHQAFLADWRPGSSSLISSKRPTSNLGEISKDGAYTREQPNFYGLGTDKMNRFPYLFSYHHHLHASSHFTHSRYSTSIMQPNHQVSGMTLNTSRSQIHMWPSRTRRTAAANLVKLAPELPPVNLPPSVRIISQSSFNSNQSMASKKVSDTGGGNGDAGKGNSLPQLLHVANLGTSNSEKTERDGSNQVTQKFGDSCPKEASDSHQKESVLVQDTSITGAVGTDSDLQMHPLLFQAPEDRPLQYYPLNYNTGTSNSFIFFSGNQPQLNLSLFHNPHQAHHVVNSSIKSSKSKEPTSESCGIDFHPLLQRIDEENNDLVVASSSTEQLTSLGGKSVHLPNCPTAYKIRPAASSSTIATGPEASIHHEKANELDLEIHLSSRSTKEEPRQNGHIDANLKRSAASAPSSGNMEEIHKSDGPSHQHGEHCSSILDKSISDTVALFIPDSDASMCNMGDVADQLHPKIVMEQEELSDSDEEIEELVEFECEEMADSDGEEGSGCGTVSEVQEQEVPSSAREEGSVIPDHADPQCELQGPVHPRVNTDVSQIGTSTFLKLHPTSIEKDASNSSWLRLDSCAAPKSEAKNEEAVVGKSHAAENLGRPNRSCKKTRPKDVMDMAQQLSLGPLAVSTLKRPRKRSSRMNTSMGRVKEDSRNEQDNKS